MCCCVAVCIRVSRGQNLIAPHFVDRLIWIIFRALKVEAAIRLEPYPVRLQSLHDSVCVSARKRQAVRITCGLPVGDQRLHKWCRVWIPEIWHNASIGTKGPHATREPAALFSIPRG